MEQLPQIALFCHEEGPHLDHVLPQHILPHIVKFLTDKFTQVRKTSQAGLLLLVERDIIAPSQVEEHVVPVVMEFTTPAAHEDYRTEITQFMSKLAPLVGKDITIKCYLERFCHLCHDKLFQVRKVCASSIGEMASVVGSHITENVLVSHFRSLCQDEVWGVRKGCAETITVFSSCVKSPVRKGVLTEAFVELLKDSSRWVRVSACQSLGPFITTFLSAEGSNCSPPSSPGDSCSEVEKSFLASYKSFVLEVLPESDSSSDSPDEYGKIPYVPTPALERFIRRQRSKEETNRLSNDVDVDVDVDQNQNTKLISTTMSSPHSDTDFAAPMEVDNENDAKDEDGNLLYSFSSDVSTTESCTTKNISPSSSTQSKLMENMYSEQNGNNDDNIDNDKSENKVNNEIEKRLKNYYETKKSSFLSQFKNNGNENVPNVQRNDDEDQQQQPQPEQNNHISSFSFSSSSIKLESKLKANINSSSLDRSNPFCESTEYDTWQYWREPILDLDIDMLDKTTDANNKMDIDVSINEDQETFVEVSSTPSTTNLVIGDNQTTYITPDVHRSYMNLFSVSTNLSDKEKRVHARYGFESLKLSDVYDDEDSDEQLNPTFLGDDYAAHALWGNRNCRPRLLTDLPKTINPIIQDIVPEVLLEHFTSLCQQSKDHQNMDSEILSFCVYNFPAVVLTLGPLNWSLVRDCYEALACNMQWKIRYTLASSLHEIANILGPELSERDLLPFYNATTKDLDEVRIGVLRNLASFIKMLGGEAQRRCLETLERFAITENFRNWRFRLELAEQIRKLTGVYEAEEISKHLCPLTMDLLVDRVAEVRKEALSVIPFLVARLNYSYADYPNNSSVVKEFLDLLIKTLCHSEVWSRRQAFAILAGQLIEIGAMSPPQFAQNILPHFLALSKDKVPNVRLKVAQSIVMNIINQEYFNDPTNPVQDELQITLIELQQDSDRDVRYSAHLQEDDDEFEFTTTD